MSGLNDHDQFSATAETLQSAVRNELHASAANEHRHDLEPMSLAERAERELRRREYRSRYLPQDFISDAPWGMLLELFASEQRGRTRLERDLCGISSISPATATRWLLAMEQAGFLRV
jgi:hypothetical protein